MQLALSVRVHTCLIGFPVATSSKKKPIFLYPLWFDPLPNHNVLEKSKFKTFADDKLNSTWQLQIVLGWIENIVGKGENADPYILYGYTNYRNLTKCRYAINGM